VVSVATFSGITVNGAGVDRRSPSSGSEGAVGPESDRDEVTDPDQLALCCGYPAGRAWCFAP
jgi:hypothetical protein